MPLIQSRLKPLHKFPRVNYIGSKAKLINWMFSHIDVKRGVFVDAFAGSGSVGWAAKERGFNVITNDILYSNYITNKALIENNSQVITGEDLQRVFDVEDVRGFMTHTYTNRYYFESECVELDTYREGVMRVDNEYKRALLFALIKRCMIIKMPFSHFLPSWKSIKKERDEEYVWRKYKRRGSTQNFTFKRLMCANYNEYNQGVIEGVAKSYNEDTFELLPKLEGDVLYLDPPYIGTLSRYHSLYRAVNDFILGEKSSPYKDDFNSKRNATSTLHKLFTASSGFRCIAMSYSNLGTPDINTLKKIMKSYGDVSIREKRHDYSYTSAKRRGVGKEYIIICRR